MPDCLQSDAPPRPRSRQPSDGTDSLYNREVWENGQKRALDMALDGAALDETLGTLVSTVMECTDHQVRAAFYLVNPEGSSIHHIVGMPPSYAKQVDGFKVGPETLACDLITHASEPLLTSDVREDPRWKPWLWLAERYHYRGCWSFPVYTSAGRRVGTFTIYWSEPRTPTQRDLDFAELLTHTASIIIAHYHEAQERKKAEEHMYETEALLSAVYAQLPFAIGVADKNGRWIRSNSIMDRYVPKVIPSRDPEMLRRWRDAEGNPVPLGDGPTMKALRGEIIVGHELIYYETEGTETHLSLSTAPLRDENGEIVGATCLMMDITGRKKAEKELRESQKRYALALQHASLGTWDWDVATGDLRWSEDCSRIMGQPHKEYDHIDKFLKSVHPDDVGFVWASLEKARENSSLYNPEFRVVHQDGTVAWVNCTGRFIYDDLTGKPVRMIGVISDITERKTYESALKDAAEKSEEANQAKTDFLANMSHEIRTPMNAVLGLSNLLALDDTLSARQRDFVNTLQSSAQSLLVLINDLLDIAKIETNEITLEHIPFTFNDVIADMLNVVLVKAREKNIKIEYSPSLFGNLELLGDPHRIRQVLVNLLSNAIKFTSKGSVVLRMALFPHERDGHIIAQITVADTGIGIAPDKLDHIFEKFTQSDTSTTRKYGGTGLGLAISKNLAEIMGGSISVRSELGKGSQFTLRIPLELADASAIDIPHVIEEQDNNSEQEEPMKGCILLVEDYPPNVMVAAHMLEGMGYVCDTASNGKEALAKIRANRDRYAAVLLDVQMPEMDGFKVTHIIRQEEQEKHLPHLSIIAVTALALRGDAERCLAAGMDQYISKPFKIDELESKLAGCGM